MEQFVQDICALLVKNKIVVEREAQVLKKAFQESDQDEFDDFLVEEGLVESSDLLKVLSQYYQIPSFDVNGYFFDHFLLRKFPKDFLLRTGIIPLEVDENMLFFVAAEPTSDTLESEIRAFVSYEPEFMVGLRLDICDAVKEFYDRDPSYVESDDEQLREDMEAETEEVAKKEHEDISYSDILYRDEEDKKK